MKNVDIYNKPKSLFVLGGLLAGIGVIFGVVVLLRDFIWYLLAIPAIFIVIGLIFILIGVHRHKVLKEYNEIIKDQTAFVTTAVFVKAKFSSYQSKGVRVAGHNVPFSANIFRKIIYSYVDENGVQRKGKSQLTYLKNQVEYLRNKGQFAIKCKGPVSAIIEPVPENNGNYNF